MPYKVYKKGSGYKACKKNGNKCFSKKVLSKKKAEAQKKALYASEMKKESLIIEELNKHFNKPDSVEGNVAIFTITNDIVVKVSVPENENEDVRFIIVINNKPELYFDDPAAIESVEKANNILTQDNLIDMGNLAIEAIRGESPFNEHMSFERLYGDVFS